VTFSGFRCHCTLQYLQYYTSRIYSDYSELTTASYHSPNADCHPAQALANNINNILLYTRRNAKTFYLNLFSYFGDEYAFRSKLCTYTHIYIYIYMCINFPHIIYIYTYRNTHIYTTYIPP